MLPPVGRIHQLHLEAGLVPLLFNRARWNFGIEHFVPFHRSQPASTDTGTEIKPRKIAIAITRDTNFSIRAWRALWKPKVWRALQIPWYRCRHKAAMATT